MKNIDDGNEEWRKEWRMKIRWEWRMKNGQKNEEWRWERRMKSEWRWEWRMKNIDDGNGDWRMKMWMKMGMKIKKWNKEWRMKNGKRELRMEMGMKNEEHRWWEWRLKNEDVNEDGNENKKIE